MDESEKSSLLHSNNDAPSYNSYQWWERPNEAHGTTHHLDLRIDSRQATGINHSDGDGSVAPDNDGGDEIGSLAPPVVHEKKLNQWFATAISGNDITSSVLYVSGVAAATCGVYAPIALFLVSVLLALFRPIYTEVVTALPMNGGTYNALLNTTSKQVASVAGALSLLSYVATAVVSAASAMSYLHTLWHGLNIDIAVVVVLVVFAVLNLIGITESAVVATVLFVFHCITLFVLIGFSSAKFFEDFSLFKQNWELQLNDEYPLFHGKSIALLIFYGYGVSMLGITGFETSANFVEEQAPGVFPKTLRNMWVAVAFFNPILSLLSFGLLPLDVITGKQASTALLSLMASAAVKGTWLKTWVVVDSVLVLSGAVLTAYVGVTGLARRLALDRILAQFLLAENRLRHTNHFIILGFCGLACSLYFIVGGGLDTLSGVYTSAFLCVMTMFAVGNMMLKYKRSRLPRETEAPWPVVIFAFAGVVTAFVANAMADSKVLAYFALYFIATMIVFMAMFWRVRILKLLLYFMKLLIRNDKWHTRIEKKIQKLNSSKIVFFCREDNLAVLNKALLYIRDNEQSNWVMMVHVYKNKENIPPKLEENVRILEQAWPKFRIDLIVVQGDFGPNLIDQLSYRLDVPKNFMFITTPSEKFSHKLADLGGLRLVTH